MTDLDPLPIVQGDWVAERRSEHCMVARVRQSYWERPGTPDSVVLMDLIPYDFSGGRLGRITTPEGGPTTFEPAIEWNEERWIRIAKPDFPIGLSHWNLPVEDKPGWVTPTYTIHNHEDTPGARLMSAKQGVKHIAVRTVVKKQSRDYARPASVVFVPAAPSNGPEIERAALLRAAQELRDMARMLGAESASMVRSRAKALEAQAEGLR